MTTASTSGSEVRSPSPATTAAVYATAYDLFQKERYADAASVFRLMLRLAASDERAWVGLAECHDRIGQDLIALEIFGAGIVATRAAGAPSVRCLLGRARVLRKLDRDAEAREAWEEARDLAGAAPDDELTDLVVREGGGA